MNGNGTGLDYRFDPHQTRSAQARVARRFPLQQGSPPSLTRLFQWLEQLDVAGLAALSQGLTARDLDLLCAAFNRAPTHRALVGVALILGFLGDRRFAEVLRHFLFQAPATAIMRVMQEPWREGGFVRLLPAGMRWVDTFFADADLDLVSFVIREVSRDQLTLEKVLPDSVLREPLARALVDFIFSEGHSLITRIKSGQARTIAAQFLVDRRDGELQAFFNHYPESGWPPAFLELVYQAKGMPDPDTRPFYRPFDKGRLWAFRQKLFRARMGSGEAFSDQDPFWQPWLHRCQDWRRAPEGTYLYLRPLKIKDMVSETEIKEWVEAETPAETIKKDIHWETRMTNLLQDRLGW